MRIRFATTLLAIVTAMVLLPGCSKESQEKRSLSRAQAFDQKNQLERAEIEYMNALRLNPAGAEAAKGLGLLYYKQGAVTRSIPYLRRARELLPNNVEVRARHALLLIAVGERAQAREDAKFILSKDPKNPDAPFILSDTAASPQDDQETLSLLDSLPGGAAKSAPVLTAKALIAFRSGKPVDGERLLNEALAADGQFDLALATAAKYWQARGQAARADEYAKKATDHATPYSPRTTFYAQVMLQRGNVALARASLQEVIARTPGYLPPKLMLAEVLAAERKFDESLALVTEVVNRDPINPEATLLRARLNQAKGKLDKASTDLERLVSAFPSHPKALYQLATIQIANGETGKAMGSLGKALGADPDYLEAAALMAEINLRQNEAANAQLILNDLLKRNPKYLRGRMLLAEVYRLQGRFDDARATYLAIEADLPNDAQIPLIRGMMEVQGKRADAARSAFERAYQLSNQGLPALDQLTSLDVSVGKVNDAIARIEGLIAGGRNEAPLHILLGRTYVTTKRLTEAEAEFRKAIALKPDDRTGYFLLARIYIDANQTDKALENLRLVVEKNPKDTSALLLTGILLEQKNDFEGAKSAYEKILVADPKFSPALNNLAYLYAEKFNRLDDAHELATRARELSPNDPYAADTLGWILYRQGKYSWALSLVQEAAEKFPTNGEIQYHLGMIYYRMGDSAAAKSALAKSLELDPDFPGRKEAADRLAILSNQGSSEAELERLLKDTPEDPIALGRLAELRLAKGKADEAIAIYERMLKSSPGSITALKGLATAYLANKDYAKATEMAREVRKTQKQDGEMAAVLGRSAWATGDRKYAYSMLQEANRKLPDDALLAAELAEAAYSQGRVSEHRSLLETGKPDSRLTGQTKAIAPSAWAKDGSVRVAALMEKAKASKSPADARKALESALEIYPDFLPAVRELALTLIAANVDLNKAYDYATRVREADRTDKEIARALGTLALQRGDFSRAATLLGEVAASSNEAQVHFLLGKAQSQVKGANAKPALKRALELGLSGSEKTEAEELIKK